jgi:Carboxypeptidase regulatory-like domain
MSRAFAATTGLFVAACSWSVAAQQPATAGARSVAKSVVPRVAAARSNAPIVIRGNVLDSDNGPLPGRLVRLRDARLGRVVETRLTDESGRFAFTVVDPGSYIVELLGQERTPLATSQILTVDFGDTVSAVVKLQIRVKPFAGFLSSSIAPAAAVIATQAAAMGITAVVPTAPVSPNQ